MDAFIYLFVDDGSLDVGDGIDGNDDALPGAGFGDGSTSSLDSYLSMFLSAGDYVLAIGDLYLSLENAVGGINYDSFYPAVYDGDYYSNSSLCGGGYNCDFADYQITFGGDVTVQNVPEPSTIALLSIGLLGMGLARRRKV